MLFNPFEILVWKMKKEWSRGFAWKEIEQHFTAAADTRTRHTLLILGLKQVIKPAREAHGPERPARWER